MYMRHKYLFKNYEGGRWIRLKSNKSMSELIRYLKGVYDIVMVYDKRGIIYDSLLIKYGLKTPFRAAGMNVNHGWSRSFYRKIATENFKNCWKYAKTLKEFENE